MRKISDFIILFFKGIGMGAADVVPGVSGGTIAFITGIYEELINSIKSIDIQAFKLLLRLRISLFWKRINGNFLVTLLFGILVSVFSLARLLSWLMTYHPVLIWSFFFGLIAASAIIVLKRIKSWDIFRLVALIAGAVIMFFITRLAPAQSTEAYWYIFLAGALAICAMVLPGISGAFILLILGKYRFMLDAISELKITIILFFALGAVTGLLSFANLLAFLFRKYHDITVAFLSGFIIGSLNKIWPWKETITTAVDSHGNTIPVIQKNILPQVYADITGTDPQLFTAVILIVIAFVLVIIIDRSGGKNK